jgi:selenide,water dikinase
VTGEVHPDRVITTGGAQPGDQLYLTKPLCSGLVATAVKRGLCPPELERETVALMSQLNRAASEAMVSAGASAATDITGFGLLGHLANFSTGAEIEVRAVPVLPGVRELAADDLFPAGSRRNYQALEEIVDWGGLPEPERLLLCDAQTSGGLLVALPPERADAFLERMAAASYPAVRIGVVSDGPIRIVT